MSRSAAPPKVLPRRVRRLMTAYGGEINELLPRMSEIPNRFKGSKSRWFRIATAWIERGGTFVVCRAKEGIIREDAIAHLRAIGASWEPSRRHRAAGMAYLMSMWFRPVEFHSPPFDPKEFPYEPTRRIL